MVIKTKKLHKRKSQVASRKSQVASRKSQVASRKYKTMKGGSNYLPHQKPQPPRDFRRINNSTKRKRSSDPRFGFLKDKSK